MSRINYSRKYILIIKPWGFRFGGIGEREIYRESEIEIERERERERESESNIETCRQTKRQS